MSVVDNAKKPPVRAAYARGYRTGRSEGSVAISTPGQSGGTPNPYQPESVLYQAWVRGYQAGAAWIAQRAADDVRKPAVNHPDKPAKVTITWKRDTSCEMDEVTCDHPGVLDGMTTYGNTWDTHAEHVVPAIEAALRAVGVGVTVVKDFAWKCET